jgi:hypothetical protein
MQEIVNLFKNLKTIFLFKLFELGKVLFWIGQNLNGFQII